MNPWAAAEHARIVSGKPDASGGGGDQRELVARLRVLSDDVLDRIDEIVPPGITLNPADNGWVSPALEASARRR